MVSKDEVIYAYRMLLGREPETDAAIQGHLGAADWLELRNKFVRSAEFHESLGPVIVNREQYDNLFAPPSRVDVEISEDRFAILLHHLKEAWEALGVEKPHWSVLTAPIFDPGQIADNINTFYDSGVESWLALERAAERAGRLLPGEWTIFELGCGVGRVTAQLAKRFRSVTAVDVSRPHLELAKAHLAELSIANTSLSVLSDLDQLAKLEPFDMFYSIIVLQHNPPPLIYRILEMIFRKVKPGGCVYFQLPTSKYGYEFNIDDYINRIKSEPPTMETHVLPQKDLFRLLYNNGIRVLDIQRDTWQSPPYVSFSMFAEKLF